MHQDADQLHLLTATTQVAHNFQHTMLRDVVLLFVKSSNTILRCNANHSFPQKEAIQVAKIAATFTVTFDTLLDTYAHTRVKHNQNQKEHHMSTSLLQKDIDLFLSRGKNSVVANGNILSFLLVVFLLLSEVFSMLLLLHPLR